MALDRIIKRDGRIEKFRKSKIVNVIRKAAEATGEFGEEEVLRLANEVIKILKERFKGRKIPHVEDVQDTVEYVLVREDRYKTAKAFIIYREEHRKLREAKKSLGIKDDMHLSLNALKVMKKRYFLRDKEGRVLETPKQLFTRVARAVAKAEKNKRSYWEKLFFEEMVSLRFIPGGRILSNAGTELNQLFNCFVVPVEDSIEGIFNAVKWGALIHKTGGGTGYNFSKLRPMGDYVRSVRGYASGPVNFMELFDTMCRVVSKGGKQRGAMMGILNINHPDIIEFISSKQNGGLTNFNISVGVTDDFMRAVEDDALFPLINSRTGEIVHKVSAKKLFDFICSTAWRTGDPGMVFLDTIEKANPLKGYETIDAVNVCGEIPLPPFDACNLGSLNLEKFVKEKRVGGKVEREVDWNLLGKSVEIATRFLDDVIDVSRFPLPQIKESVKNHRRLGLGIMGFAEMLFLLKIPYDSEKGIKFAEKLMKFIRDRSHEVSIELSKEKGVFPLWDKSIYRKMGVKIRNCAITAIAPTGTISMIPEVTGGIEPVFSLALTKHVVEKEGVFYLNRVFEKIAIEEHFYSEKMLDYVMEKGHVRGFSEVPVWAQRVFGTALEISPEYHVKMQASFQKYVDNAVAKTINLPRDASIDAVADVFMLAWKLGCKGITVYRDGSKDHQILTIGQSKGKGGVEVQTTTELTPLEKRRFKI